MPGLHIKWNFMTAGFFGFLIFIHTEPTALNNLAVQPYHGEKRSPTAKTFTNALAHLQSSRSVLWSHRILTIPFLQTEAQMVSFGIARYIEGTTARWIGFVIFLRSNRLVIQISGISSVSVTSEHSALRLAFSRCRVMTSVVCWISYPRFSRV